MASLMLVCTFSTRPFTLAFSSSAGVTSFSHMSCQLAMLRERFPPISCMLGQRRICATKKGAIMNSMKPICELGLFSLSLSFRNWTGIPSSFS